ncbi:MAG: M18 family aminopeptidase [Breznakia sp.]
MMDKTNEKLLNFLRESVSPFHAVENMLQQLLEQGYTQLLEGNPWILEKGGKYVTTRNGSSILAFQIGDVLDDVHFQVSATHSDSPTFCVKEKAELTGIGGYIQLNTEPYGGMIAATWFDRPLSLAGRVVVKEKGEIVSKLVNINKDLLVIPNVAIHMNREVNKGINLNSQIDMLPLFSAGEAKTNDYYHLLAQYANVEAKDIYSSDMQLYNRNEPTLWGVKNEFISAQRLDNLQCSFATLQGFMKANNPHAINVFACFDNEEVGSATKQGAGSTYLYDTLKRITHSLHLGKDAYYAAIAKSFMLSCDNAHALHPNHPEKTDKENYALMNKGLVIKHSANQKYTTDAQSCAIFEDICAHANVPLQHFSNRSDMLGGSTLGNISSTKVSMSSVDVGLAQLAMHSAYETAGSKDSAYLIKACEVFFNANIQIKDPTHISIRYK